MPLKKVDKIWMNGKFVNWDDAKIHILSHVITTGRVGLKGSEVMRLRRERRSFVSMLT